VNFEAHRFVAPLEAIKRFEYAGFLIVAIDSLLAEASTEGVALPGDKSWNSWSAFFANDLGSAARSRARGTACHIELHLHRVRLLSEREERNLCTRARRKGVGESASGAAIWWSDVERSAFSIAIGSILPSQVNFATTSSN